MGKRFHIQTEDLHFLSIGPTGELSARASGADESETFEIARADGRDGAVHDDELVLLRTRDGRLVSNMHGTLEARAPTAGETEFRVELCGSRALEDHAQFRLKTRSGLPVGAERGGGRIVAGQLASEDCITFIADFEPDSPLAAQHVSLRTHDGRHFLRAVNGGGGEVRATSNRPTRWETFDVLYAGDAKTETPGAVRIHLRTASGHYIGVDRGDAGHVHARALMAGECETFVLVPARGESRPATIGGRYTLLACNGRYVRATNGGGGVVEAVCADAKAWETFALERPLPTEADPPRTPEQIAELGKTHLAQLQEAQRLSTINIGPRTRRAPRSWPRLKLARERLARALRPTHGLGRRWAWLKLVRRSRHFYPRVAVAFFVVALAAARYPLDVNISSDMWIVIAAVVGLPVAGAVVLLWDEFFRSPWRVWRLRRRIASRPSLVLPTSPRRAEKQLIPHDDPLDGELIGRTDLAEEVIPGLLRREHRDIQVLVGEPGSGKTMALVYLAGVLARIGFVPVLVPLRTESADEIEAGAEKALARMLCDRDLADAEINTVWRWLRRRNRVVVLTDDIDQISSAEGERGFVLRRTLDELANNDLPIIVTARPAGIPAGVAASSIDLQALDEEEIVNFVKRIAERDPGARSELEVSEDDLRRWVHQGRLHEAPFYLELLASLFAAGCYPDLPSARLAGESNPGRRRPKQGGGWEWDPLWIRFVLLEHFYEQIARGRVRRWLGIETRERRSTLSELEDAALGMLRAGAMTARAPLEEDAPKPKRWRLEHFIDPDDRAELDRLGRTTVSAHEIVDTGQRLRLIDHDQQGELQFRHRIMQAYLAARRLLERDRDHDAELIDGDGTRIRDDVPGAMVRALDKRLDDLLDRHHPEKLTAQMTVTFAAIRADELSRTDGRAEKVYRRIMCRLLKEGGVEHPKQPCPDPPRPAGGPARTDATVPTAGRPGDDPAFLPDPERRRDPDNALMMLTTAARIARVTGAVENYADDIVDAVRLAHGATRWIKIDAIEAVAALDGAVPGRWLRVWEFARDPDYRVRRGASEAIQAGAANAYEALRTPITELILRAAARTPWSQPSRDGLSEAASPLRDDDVDTELWQQEDDAWSLKALGWILPAMVSGMRELPPDWTRSSDNERHAAYVREARRSLEWLVALAFEGGRGDLEAAVAQGFRDDAVRHADDPGHHISGPGWVAANRELVADICLVHAESWYSRMVLHQAIALYAIAGSEQAETLGLIAWYLDPGREQHPFVRRAAALGREALERKLLGSELWTGLTWRDEGELVSRRATDLDARSAQLLGDVTLLLNLTHNRGEDSRAQLRHMHALPHCLSTSTKRTEILGAGCPPSCGCGLCPYRQPPPDEPNTHRGISRAFCREQRDIAERHRPPWQPGMKRGDLAEFWQQMERRARS